MPHWRPTNELAMPLIANASQNGPLSLSELFRPGLEQIFLILFNVIAPFILTSILIGTFLSFLFTFMLGTKCIKDIVFCSLLLCSYSTLGFCLGLFIGFSQKSDVSAFLPSIVPFASGTIAYLTAKGIPKQLRVLSPLIVMTSVCGTIVGTFYGQFLKAHLPGLT